MCFCNIASVLPLARDGKVRVLAVTSLKRAPQAPDIPTMAESGFQGFDVTAWFGLMAPAGTPKAVIDKVYAESAKALAAADLRQKFEAQGMVPVGNSPDEFATQIKSEIPYWAKLIKAIGLKL
jgi:tripartite-type tricarboxylate transporter receptor subunit TctC